MWTSKPSGFEALVFGPTVPVPAGLGLSSRNTAVFMAGTIAMASTFLLAGHLEPGNSLPGKMTPLQPDHIHPPGGSMEQSKTSLQRDGLAAGFCVAVS